MMKTLVIVGILCCLAWKEVDSSTTIDTPTAAAATGASATSGNGGDISCHVCTALSDKPTDLTSQCTVVSGCTECQDVEVQTSSLFHTFSSSCVSSCTPSNTMANLPLVGRSGTITTCCSTDECNGVFSDSGATTMVATLLTIVTCLIVAVHMNQ